MLCLLPTVFFVGYIFGFDRVGSHLESVESQTGLRIRYNTYRTPVPGVTQLEHVRLTDGRKRLATVSQIACIKRDEFSTIRLSPFSIEQKNLPELLDRLKEIRSDTKSSLQVLCEQITIVRDARSPSPEGSTDGEFVMFNVGLVCSSQANKLSSDVKFSLVESEKPRMWLRFSIEPDSPSQQKIEWAFDTGNAQIPCWIAAGWLKSFGFVADAQFKGKIHVESRASSQGFEPTNDHRQNTRFVDSSFSHINLTKVDPNHLAGHATLDLKNCVLQNGKVVIAEGGLSSKNAMLSEAVQSGAVTHLKMPPYGSPIGNAVFEINCHFRIENHHIVIDSPNNAIAKNAGQEIARAFLKSNQRLPLENLAKLFSDVKKR